MLNPPRDLGPVRSVLDVGCGIRPQTIIAATDRYLGIDVHPSYVDWHNDPGHYRCSHWRPALKGFDDNEFDAVVALDFIEHLTKREGKAFLKEAERVGRLVVIFTPHGPCPQRYEPGEPDQWGMDGGHWQTHRSSWTPEDFPGWETYPWDQMHVVDANLNPLPEPVGAFWAIKQTEGK